MNGVEPQPPARVIVSPPVRWRSKASEAPERTKGATEVTLIVIVNPPVVIASGSILVRRHDEVSQRRAVMTVFAAVDAGDDVGAVVADVRARVRLGGTGDAELRADGDDQVLPGAAAARDRCRRARCRRSLTGVVITAFFGVSTMNGSSNVAVTAFDTVADSRVRS